jgi:DNA-binding MarR family transcriptional regulator
VKQLAAARRKPDRASGDSGDGRADYRLDDQFGYILRQVTQRHTAIFAETIPEGVTTTQFAALVRLYEMESCSQNRLGRLTSMDAATIKGVIARLAKRGLARTWTDPEDSRRLLVGLTDAGIALTEQAIPKAFDITDKTLEPLNERERRQLVELLLKLR